MGGENKLMRIVLSDNKELVEKINMALAKNDGYCPCVLARNEDTKCMCKDFINRQSVGPCHCGKYIKVEV